MEETISLKEIFEVVKKRLMLIILCVLGAALLAAVASFFILTPSYESSSQFIVNQAEQDKAMKYEVNDIRTNVELINTYNVIIKSNAILEDVSESLNGIYSADDLKDKIQVSSEQDSQVVTVTATDEKAELAVDIANTTVETFQDKIADIMNVDNVSVLTKAVMKDDPSPVAPRPLLNIAIAVVLGGMVGVGIAFLLAYLDNTIRTEEDVEKQLELPLLGVISHIDGGDVQGGQHAMKQSRSRRGELHAQKKSV
jgi:capsular polysaccharide biosynthesis protein